MTNRAPGLRSIPLILAFAAAFLLSLGWPVKLYGQSATPTSTPPMETIQSLLERLTPEQKQQFDNAGREFSAHHFSEALAVFRALLVQLPGDPILVKFACESAIDIGDLSFARASLQPIVKADSNDWQAAALLTRVCAETADVSCRDTQMTHLTELSKQHITPSRLVQYVVEQVKVGENTLVIHASLQPWGRYNVYDFGQLSDPQGRVFLRLSLESSDIEQPLFAQQHPQEAAAGMRSFTLDGYLETGLNSAGQRTQTHYTYKFFTGQPSYQTVHDEFVSIAGGKEHAISSRTGLTVP